MVADPGPSARDQIALIKSVVRHLTEGREELVLTQLRRILDGATLEELASEVD